MADETETARLQSLARYEVMDTAPEEAFDRLTSLAADLFDVPIALVSLVDADRQWFKSHRGLDAAETPRNLAFCAHAIQGPADSVMVVPDATEDARFVANPLVTGDPNIRFYAGAVLTGHDGYNLGTLCIIDDKARPALSERDTHRLQTLARVVVDELELRRANRESAEKQRLLEMAESVAGLGHWRMDSNTREIEWSDEMYRIYGLEPGIVLDLPALQAMTHPDDAEESRLRIRRLMTKGARPNVRTMTRIIRADGRLRYLSGNSQVQLGPDGEVAAVVGTVVDVTEHKEAELALAQREARYRALAENAPDIIAECSLDGVMTYMSPACLALTGFTQEELVGRRFVSLMHEEDGEKVLDMCRRVFESRGALSTWPVEFRALHKDGREIWMECKPTLVVDPATGRYTGLTDIIRDVTARKALEADLREARVTAEAATAVKSEFLANMSHELRTPLTSIIGFTGLAAAQDDLPPMARAFVARVQDASRALLCTVNDILDFSKLEAGQVTFTPTAVSPKTLCASTVDLLSPQAAAKDLEMLVDCRGLEGLMVRLDPDRVRQVLLNLVGNAVKFTDSGTVALRALYNQGRQRLHVDVIDTGGGISPEDLGKLFQRFSQVDGSLTRKQGGTGLGLAICKGLVEAMGGEIGVQSDEGQGSRFWFEIPAPLVGQGETVAEGRKAASDITFPGVRVLVADDHPFNRELVRLFLTAVGAEVSEACNGLEAVESAEQWPYDVILMDLRMPQMDGWEAERLIREGGGPNDLTPILAFTADAESDHMGAITAAGFDGMVAKPVDPAVLIAAIARATDFVGDQSRANPQQSRYAV